jgi:hypothetical protein
VGAKPEAAAEHVCEGAILEFTDCWEWVRPVEEKEGREYQRNFHRRTDMQELQSNFHRRTDMHDTVGDRGITLLEKILVIDYGGYKLICF